MRVLLLFSFLFLCFVPQVHAEDIGGARLEKYMQSVVDLYNGKRVDNAAVKAFAQEHLTKDVRVILQTKNNLNTDKSQNLDLGYDDIMKIYDDQKISVLNSSASYQILDIEDLGEERIRVTFRFVQNATLEGQLANGNVGLTNYQHRAECKEDMKLVDDVVKVYRSVCSIDEKYDRNSNL